MKKLLKLFKKGLLVCYTQWYTAVCKEMWNLLKNLDFKVRVL